MLCNNYEKSNVSRCSQLQLTKSNVERELLLPSGEILSRSPRFAMRAFTKLSDVWRSFCLQGSAAACDLIDGCVTMLSDSQL